MTQAWTLIQGSMSYPSPLAPCPWPPLLGMVPDAWVIGFPIVLLVIQVVVLVIQGTLLSKTRKIDTLEADVRRSANDTIDTRFGYMTQQIGEINERLLRGEDAFKALREADTKLQVQFVERVSELKTYVAQNCASKEDVEEIKTLMMRRQ